MSATAYKLMQEANRQQVCKLLNWVDQQFCDFQHQCGLEYLERIEAGWLAYSPLFWSWWRNHWDKAEEPFLQQAKYLRADLRKELYMDCHDPYTFSYYPHKSILEEAYQTYKDKAA